MGRFAVKKVPPNVAKDVRSIANGDKKLDHPYYVTEQRKGTGKATCRQCDQTIAEGEPTLYFHYAPEDDNVWIRTRGTIHADDCEGGKDEWTKCPKCRKQVPRADWKDHWAKEKGKRVAAEDRWDPTRRNTIPKKGMGIWETRWSDMADKGFSRDQALHIYDVLDQSGAHGSFQMSEHSRVMMNKYFPPQDQGFSACVDCKGTGKDAGMDGFYTGDGNCASCRGTGIEKTEPLGKKGAKGLDQTAKPGNSTSMDEEDNDAYVPRVDPYQAEKLEKAQRGQLDQEARKLQRGMKGLDQFAGKTDPADLDAAAQYLEAALADSQREEEENDDERLKLLDKVERGWKSQSHIKIALDRTWMDPDSPVQQSYQRQLKEFNEESKKPQEKFEACYRCNGTGDSRPHLADEPEKCYNCKGSGLTEKAPLSPPRKPSASYVESATGLRAWGGLERVRVNDYPKYPQTRTSCGNCSGTGQRQESWMDKPQNCYSCAGSGENVESDKRNLFENALEGYSKGSGSKNIVGIQRNTGVHEDQDQYHVRLHDTDILSYAKDKPEVSFSTGGWDSVTTKDRINTYSPKGFRIGSEEVAPKDRRLVITTPSASYVHHDGITINTETGKATDGSKELMQCKECYKVRTDEEMPKHQKRHDSYRAAYEKNPYARCGECNATGTTKPWQTVCKTCKGASYLKSGGMCPDCRASGIEYHRGAEPKTEHKYNSETNMHETNTPNPDKCGKCGGEGKFEKYKPRELEEAS